MKPHKACDVDITKLKYPVIVMPKLDGVRACHFNNEFTSRTLKTFRNDKLDHFNNSILSGLDGELVVGSAIDGDSCRRTTGFCNSHSFNVPNISLPIWYIFDYIVNEDTPYIERLSNAKTLVSVINTTTNIQITMVAHVLANSKEELMKLHCQYIDRGYEGTVIRDIMGKHKNGRCTINEGAFLKMKDIADEEAVIVSLIEAEENLNEETTNELGYKTRSSHKENKVAKGMVGSIMAKIPDGRIITISAGHMCHDDRVYYWNNQEKIIGRVCTYKYMPYGEKDNRRHPRFKGFRDNAI